MLANWLNTKPAGRKNTAENSCGRRSASFSSECDDFLVGFMAEDLPLISTDGSTEKIKGCSAIDDDNDDDTSSSLLTLRQVLRSSVGVIGESNMGLTEKVVLLNGKICAVKRFRNVSVRRKEFGNRIVRLAMVTRQCKYLVPIKAYFYAKRIKFVVCEYYPMGSLSDLLTSARKLGQTPLNWNQRLKIIISIANALEYIHTRRYSSPLSSAAEYKHLKLLNVHGNVKSSNVMINYTDFTARLSDYGFVTLAEKVSDIGQHRNFPATLPDFEYLQSCSQKSDVYNFGIIILDILRVQAGSRRQRFGQSEIVAGVDDVAEEEDMFEFFVEGNERIQALKVLDIGWECVNRSPGSRPTIRKIVQRLLEISDDQEETLLTL